MHATPRNVPILRHGRAINHVICPMQVEVKASPSEKTLIGEGIHWSQIGVPSSGNLPLPFAGALFLLFTNPNVAGLLVKAENNAIRQDRGAEEGKSARGHFEARTVYVVNRKGFAHRALS